MRLSGFISVGHYNEQIISHIATIVASCSITRAAKTNNYMHVIINYRDATQENMYYKTYIR